MTPEQFARVEEAFEALSDLPLAERAGRLRILIEEDSEVGHAVAAMLAEDVLGSDFLERPVHDLELPLERLLDEGLKDASSQSPGRIGPFEILGRLGSGGMGTVYLASQAEPRRRVAVKVLHPGLSHGVHRRRFRREARLLARLRHPGIAQVYESGLLGGEDGSPYLAMELVEGLPLDEYARVHALDVPQRVKLLARVCDAVHHAHERGVVHRDLKPDNVLVVEGAGPGGEPLPKVLDFGIARAADVEESLATFRTTEGQVLGTLAYMSPEQAASGIVDRRTDVYSLGAILFHLLAGRLPHDLAGQPLPVALRTIQEEEPTRLGALDTRLRGDLDLICARALAVDAERRYPTAAALAADLRRHLANEPIAARPPSTMYRLRKFARRNRILVGGVLSTMLVLLLGTVVSTAFAFRAARSADGARHASYRACIDAAAAHRLMGDPGGAAANLELAPPELRGWEWNHLAVTGDPTVLVRDLGAFAGDCRSDVACDPDGVFVLARPDGDRIRLMDVGTGREIAAFAAAGEVVDLDVSRDGRRLAALSRDPARLTVWDVRHVEPLLDREVGPERRQVTLSEGGAFVSVRLHDGAYHPGDEAGNVVLEVESGRPVWDLHFQFYGTALSESAGQPRLVAWTREPGGGVICLRDSRGRVVLPAQGLVTSGAFDRSGDRLALGTNHDNLPSLQLFDVHTLEVLHVFDGLVDAVRAMAWGLGGDRIAAALGEREVRVWKLATDEAPVALPGAASGLAFDPRGTLLAAATSTGARVWDLRAAGERVLDARETYVYQAVFSPDGTLVATGGADHEVRVLDADSGALLRTYPFPWKDVSGLAFSADGLRLVAAHHQRTLVWNLVLGGEAVEIPLEDPEGPSEGLMGRGFWRVARGGSKCVAWGSKNNLATSTDGRWFVRGENAGYDVVERSSGRALVAGAGKSDVSGRPVALSPDGRLLAVGLGADIRLFETLGERLVTTFRGHASEVLGVAFSPDGRRLASGSRDRTLRIWDAEGGAPLLTLEGHAGYVHSCEFSPDGSLIASASGDGTVRLWDAMPPQERRRRTEQARARRERLAPVVEARLADHEDPLAILSDATPAADRAQVLQLLLEWAPR